jgi:hypothetical protein
MAAAWRTNGNGLATKQRLVFGTTLPIEPLTRPVSKSCSSDVPFVIRWRRHKLRTVNYTIKPAANKKDCPRELLAGIGIAGIVLVVAVVNLDEQHPLDGFVDVGLHVQLVVLEVGVDGERAPGGVLHHHPLDDMARDAMKQTRLLVNNPREVTQADALAIYKATW